MDFADYERSLRSLQGKLQLIQQAYLGTSRRAVLVLEGWDTAGKGGIVRRLGWALDPRSFKVHPIAAPDDAYVASVIRTNGRDLDGAVNRLLAHASLSFDKNSGGAPLSLETAELAIRDLVRTPDPKKVKIEDIQKLVASHFNVSRGDILSARRTANVVRPRQIDMYLSKLLTPRSLPEIGRRFGGRDHTTVLHAVRKITGLVTTDGTLTEEI
ncbi:MAG: helix-turn-helix domain-containing protein, partial [Pseudolabrys sp.]